MGHRPARCYFAYSIARVPNHRHLYLTWIFQFLLNLFHDVSSHLEGFEIIDLIGFYHDVDFPTSLDGIRLFHPIKGVSDAFQLLAANVGLEVSCSAPGRAKNRVRSCNQDGLHRLD